LITVAGIVMWSGSRGKSTVTVAHPTVKVLLADFQNNTSDSVFDGTLESSFALALEGAPFISAYNRTQARKTLSAIDPAANVLNDAGASLVALREGVNVVISGAVDKLGEGYKISCKAVDPVSSKVLGSEVAETNTKSGVLQAVAQLADKMRRRLGDTTPESARLQQQETVTSSSLEAVHEYAVAPSVFRQVGRSAAALLKSRNTGPEVAARGIGEIGKAIAAIVSDLAQIYGCSGSAPGHAIR
jgi:hypothetical protein